MSGLWPRLGLIWSPRGKPHPDRVPPKVTRAERGPRASVSDKGQSALGKSL